MPQLPKLYLLLSSFFIYGCFVSCRITKYQKLQNSHTQTLTHQNLIPVVNPEGKSTKYKATIDVLNKHLSGIVVVKKTDSVTTHVVFVTELGMKMFDFEKKDTIINAVYVFEPLNKPKLINSLKINFKNMLLLDAYNNQSTSGLTKNKQLVYEMIHHNEKRYFVVVDTNKLASQLVFFKNKKSSKINYVYSPEANSYTQINSLQYGIVKIKIELNKIIE
jgi:hypothetical protein